MTAVLLADKITHVYPSEPGRHILRDVSMQVEQGEFAVIVGRSGSGKSTLLHVLGTMEPLQAGALWLCGTEVTRLKDDGLARFRLQNLGFVFQSFHLIDSLTAVENVRLPMELARLPRRNALTRASELLDLVGLSQRSRAFPSQLSGGEQQRVAIARALANRPAMILADEPTGNLDREAADVVLGVFEDLHKHQQVTIVLVTHDTAICDRADTVWRMEDGVLSLASSIARQ
ncbi:MAG: ABC transporter ATP-binding protein [Bacilli bacterium]